MPALQALPGLALESSGRYWLPPRQVLFPYHEASLQRLEEWEAASWKTSVKTCFLEASKHFIQVFNHQLSKLTAEGHCSPLQIHADQTSSHHQAHSVLVRTQWTPQTFSKDTDDASQLLQHQSEAKSPQPDPKLHLIQSPQDSSQGPYNWLPQWFS